MSGTVKISGLTAVSAVEGNDLLEVSEDTGSGTYASRKATATQIKAFASADSVQRSGDTMSGALTLSGAPTVDLHAATKAYVDARDGDVQGWANTQFVSLAGSTMSGALVMSDQQVSRAVMKDGAVAYHNSGTTNALDYVNGSHQRWAPNTGAQTLSISNWPPTGNLGELLIEGVNLGAATITWPTINWIKSDSTTTTTFASNGVTLQTSGIDWVLLWTRDAGTTIYGKIVR